MTSILLIIINVFYLCVFFIAGDATLVFEIELFDFHGEDVTKNSDLGVVKRIKVNGEGWDMANDGALVEVKICGKTEDKVFDERTVKFEMGEGIEEGIPRGVEMALEKMKVCLTYKQILFIFIHSSHSSPICLINRQICFLISRKTN